MNYKLTLILILAGLVVVFLVQNVAVVEIQFLIWSARLPRAAVMLVALAAGIVIGWFLHGYRKYRKNRAGPGA